MSKRFPRITGKEMVNFLEIKNFHINRINGSHYIMKNQSGKITVIPVHANEKFGIGLIKEILNQTGIEDKDYIDFFMT